MIFGQWRLFEVKGFGRGGGGAQLVLYHDEAGHITSVIVVEQRDKQVTQAFGVGGGGCFRLPA